MPGPVRGAARVRRPPGSGGTFDGMSDEKLTPETRALSDEDIRDALPEDLNAAGYAGPYLFPNNNRRRIPAVLYWCIAALCLVLYLVTRGHNPVLVNGGYLAAAIGLTLIGAYSFVSGW